jgi:hypothetical protein
MNPRFLPVFFLSSLCCSLTGCNSPATPASDTAQSAKPSATEMPFPKLEKGMTAEIIRQKLGEPAEIKPMPSSTGKAEIWIYKYEKSLGMTQVAARTESREVMTLTGTGPGMTTVQEPVFTLAEKISRVTLSLLMFDGQLQVQKANVEETLDHR